MPTIEEVFDENEVLERFRSSKARSDEEDRELLRAVSIKFSVDGDSKWSKMTDEYNARAAEKKSKQWIKRNAAKIEAANQTLSIANASEDAESNRSKKKQAALDAANADAARRVARDMPGDAEGQAAFRRSALCKEFWDCIRAGDHMDESAEGIFGCKMGDSIGDAVHGTWRLLHEKNLVSQKQVEDSLADGTLPASFLRWLASIPTSQHNTQTLFLATSPEAISKLPWNISALKLCAKPGKQITVSVDNAVREKLSKLSKEECLRVAMDKSSPYELGKTMEIRDSAEASTKKNLDLLKKTTPSKVSEDNDSKAAPKKGIGEYSWVQTEDELEINVYVGDGIRKKDVSLSFKLREVSLTKPCSLHLELHAPINVEGCSWTLGAGDIVITLEKKIVGVKWPNLIKR